MIITILLTYMPVLVALMWMYNHAVFASKIKTHPIFMCLLASVVLYAFTDCAYGDSYASDRLLLTTSNLAQLVAPCVIPLTMMYLRKLRTGEEAKIHQAAWFILPAVLFTSVFLISRIAGREQIEPFLSRLYTEGPDIMKEYSSAGAAYMFFFNAALVFRIVLGIEFVSLIISYIIVARKYEFRFKHVLDFLYRKERISVLELQYSILTPFFIFIVAKIFLFRNILIAHPWLAPTVSVLFALVLTPFCYTAMFGAKKTLTLREMRMGFRYNYKPETRRSYYNEAVDIFLKEFGDEGEEILQSSPARSQEIQAQVEAKRPAPTLAVELFGNIKRDWDKDSLMGRFEHLMMEEKAFLQPGLMLSDVAEQLGSNKTYISRMVNSTYKMSFPDLVNTLRVNHVEEYLLEHRGAKQNEIAEACGFPSASSLNNTFKKITGVPPRIWLATYEQQHVE